MTQEYIKGEGYTLENRARVFWSRVDKNGPVPRHAPELGPCWLWTGSVDAGTRYGRFYGLKGMHLAHRFAWFLTHGKWPDKPYVCHACDNRLCVNPDHHFEGTAQDNNDDMTKKGRANRVGWPALSSPKQVVAIRILWETERFTIKDLSEIFSISDKRVESAIYKWANVSDKEY